MNFLDIKTLDDLEKFLGVDHKTFLFMRFAKSENRYRKFFLPKNKPSEFREINSPTPVLMNAHKILYSELYKCLKTYECSHGFIKNKSIKTNAAQHVGKAYVLNFDIEDFFPSIHIGRLIGLFARKPFSFSRDISVALSQILTCNGKLAQGSPCSPILANMIFYSVDRKILKYIKRTSICYTRYADDLTFSFNKPYFVSYFYDGTNINLDFNNLFLSSNFKLNNSKFRIQQSNQHQDVTGITVNTCLNTGHFYKYKIRSCLHALKKYGLSNSARVYFNMKGWNYKGTSTDDKQFLKYVSGLLSYYSMIRGKTNPVYLKLAHEFNYLNKSNLLYLQTNDLNLIAENSVLLINDCGFSYSTAFFYKGFIITCYHCIVESKIGDTHIFVSNNVKKTSSFDAICVYTNKNKDIAIFKYNRLQPHIDIKPSACEIHKRDEVKALGYPDYEKTTDFDIAIVEGKVTTSFVYEKNIYYSSNMDIQQGLSGGPVLNKNNELIGMVVLATKGIKRKTQNGFVDKKFIDECILKIK